MNTNLAWDTQLSWLVTLMTSFQKHVGQWWAWIFTLISRRLLVYAAASFVLGSCCVALTGWSCVCVCVSARLLTSCLLLCVYIKTRWSTWGCSVAEAAKDPWEELTVWSPYRGLLQAAIFIIPSRMTALDGRSCSVCSATVMQSLNWLSSLDFCMCTDLTEEIMSVVGCSEILKYCT